MCVGGGGSQNGLQLCPLRGYLKLNCDAALTITEQWWIGRLWTRQLYLFSEDSARVSACMPPPVAAPGGGARARRQSDPEVYLRGPDRE